VSESPSLIADSLKLLSEFQTLCGWADEIIICTSRIDSDKGRSSFWQALLKAKAKVLVIISEVADQNAFDELHRLAVLRIVDCAKGNFRPNVYMFRKGDQVRALVGTARLVPSDFHSSITVMVLWQGRRDDTLACELADFVVGCQRMARLPGSGTVLQNSNPDSRGWVFLGQPGSDHVVKEEHPMEMTPGRIRRLLEVSGWSSGELAEELECTENTVRRWYAVEGAIPPDPEKRSGRRWINKLEEIEERFSNVEWKDPLEGARPGDTVEINYKNVGVKMTTLVENHKDGTMTVATRATDGTPVKQKFFTRHVIAVYPNSREHVF
jgi:hypothetical protein